MRSTLISALAVLALTSAPVLASEGEGLRPQTPAVEIDPLTLYARTVWPDDVETVGDAAQYLLEPAGYLLVTDYPAPTVAKRIAQRPVPPIAKVHRTMPIVDALQILIGDGHWIVVDHTNKLVSFAEEK